VKTVNNDASASKNGAKTLKNGTLCAAHHERKIATNGESPCMSCRSSGTLRQRLAKKTILTSFMHR
jgi:hypothetical protein